MAERGAPPKVPPVQRRALRAVRALFTPLLPDDYLELINPLWSTRELRGRIERIERETADTVTVVIRPGYEWMGHEPGQYLRIGVVVDGVHHWRAYSLTSDPDRPDGWISITPKLVDAGKVSPYFVTRAKPGEIVRLGGVEGTFVLPDPAAREAALRQRGQRHHAGDEHAAQPRAPRRRHRRRARTLRAHRRRRDLRRAAAAASRERNPGFRLHLQLTGQQGRMSAQDLDALCPDWREREAFLSGPGPMLDALTEHWEREGDPARLHMERFQPVIGGDAGNGDRRHGALPHQRRRGRVRRRHADPGRGRERRRDASVRLPHGHLPHLRRAACAPARCATCAPARCTGSPAR